MERLVLLCLVASLAAVPTASHAGAAPGTAVPPAAMLPPNAMMPTAPRAPASPLVGAWRFAKTVGANAAVTDFETGDKGNASIYSSTSTALIFRPDGTWQLTKVTDTTILGLQFTPSSRDVETERGRWQAQGNTVHSVAESGERLAYQWQVQQTQRGRVLHLVGNGQRHVWGEYARLCRHPGGYSFFLPIGWAARQEGDVLKLVPPTKGGAPVNDAAEMYLLTVDKAATIASGLQRPDDPRAVQFLDAAVRKASPKLRRNPRGNTAFYMDRGTGAWFEWWYSPLVDDRIIAKDMLAWAVVTVSGDQVVVLLAFGVKDLLDDRQAGLCTVFRTLWRQ